MAFTKQSVLLVGAGSTFIAHAITDGLSENGIDCIISKLSTAEISKIPNKPPIIIVYLDENAPFKMDALIYIRDICMEEDKIVYLIGYSDEIQKLKDLFPENILAGCFERPINIKMIADTLKHVTKENELAGNKQHILLVDDSGTMLRTVKGWLDSKYKISMANSATAAISFLASNKPDLILLDYEMPICSGPQMLEMIRAEMKTESIPVIFLTSKGDKESVSKVLALRPQGYLLKTMSADDIVNAIDNFFITQKANKL